MSIFIYIDPSPWTKGRPRFKIVFPPKGKKHMSFFWVIWSEMTWSLYLFHWEDTEFLFNRLGSAPQWEASHRRRRVPQIWKRDFSWENPPKEMLIGTFLLPNEISTEVWFLNLNLLHDHSDFPHLAQNTHGMARLNPRSLVNLRGPSAVWLIQWGRS